MKFLKNVDVENDLKFKKVRTTSVGAKIIDIDMPIIQTCWTKILYDVDYSICTNVPELLKETLIKMDTKIIDHCAEIFNMCHENITEMYRPLLRPTENDYYFKVPISNSSVLWKTSDTWYNKSEMKEILKVGHYVRFIIKFKKLYFKDYNLTVQFELIQAEMT